MVELFFLKDFFWCLVFGVWRLVFGVEYIKYCEFSTTSTVETPTSIVRNPQPFEHIGHFYFTQSSQGRKGAKK